MPLSPDERRYLRLAKRDAVRVQDQVDRMNRGLAKVRLLRACALGDGIESLEPTVALDERHLQAAIAGRVTAFIPASGAASRLLAGLEQVDQPDLRALKIAALQNPRLRPALAVISDWRSLAAADDLEAGESPQEIADVLLSTYNDIPKALVPFHRYPGGTRTPFEEHLIDGARLLADASGAVRQHFTVSVEHLRDFERALAEARTKYEAHFKVRFKTTFSVQDPATDTVALDENGRLVWENQQILFRPGGHGALLENLSRVGGDIVFVRNIDNVGTDLTRARGVLWRSMLSGLLLALQDRVHSLIRKVEKDVPGALEDAQRFLMERFHDSLRDTSDLREGVLERLQRPIRICGMVKNDGQPGGGPFFVEGQRGPQIVEQAEIDLDDVEQRVIWESATHFNPVDMVVGLKDYLGRPWDLVRYADAERVLISDKPHGGGTIRVLEHPGLWTGGMAHWNSVFVEIPRELFLPVKTLSDLLKGER